MPTSKKLIIDGREFDVPIVQYKRRGDILDLEATRTEDGVMHRQVIGTFYNYTLNIGQCRNRKEYEDLWDVLTEPVASHSIVLPHDGITFDGYFGSVQDEIFYIYDDNGRRYRAKGLSCNVVSMRPSRIAPSIIPDDEDEEEESEET